MLLLRNLNDEVGVIEVVVCLEVTVAFHVLEPGLSEQVGEVFLSDGADGQLEKTFMVDVPHGHNCIRATKASYTKRFGIGTVAWN